jgi:hypothetical protein
LPIELGIVPFNLLLARPIQLVKPRPSARRSNSKSFCSAQSFAGEVHASNVVRHPCTPRIWVLLSRVACPPATQAQRTPQRTAFTPLVVLPSACRERRKAAVRSPGRCHSDGRREKVVLSSCRARLIASCRTRILRRCSLRRLYARVPIHTAVAPAVLRAFGCRSKTQARSSLPIFGVQNRPGHRHTATSASITPVRERRIATLRSRVCVLRSAD